MTYNISAMIGQTSLMGVAQGTNTVLGGYYYGYFILLVVFCVTFFTLKAKNHFSSDAFAAACWLCMIVSLLLRPMLLIDNYTFWASIILAAISAAILFLSGTTD
jgi:hypothetical protein